MKRLALLLSAVLMLNTTVHAANGDPYEDLAAKLSSMASKKLSEKRIAVLTFDYVDGRASSGGRAVAEKLTNRFVELGEFTVIERGMVEKVMRELEFQNTGGVDPDAAKKLGKGLGVDAIVTGTLSDASYGNVEVNARIIKTESYEIVAAATAKVKKTWGDQAAPPQEVAAAPSAESAPAPVVRKSAGPRKGRGFLDIMVGTSNSTMDFEMSTSLGSGSVTGLETNPSGVFGMRVGGFGEIFGGDVAFSVFNHANTRQRVILSGVSFPGAMMPEDFLQVSTFEISGDLLMRFPTGDKVIPYFGLGMGMSMNNVTSNSNGVYLAMSGGSRLDQTVPGFLFRVPFGVRVHVADPLDLFLEGRAWMNTFTFDQELVGVTDTITQRGFQLLCGVGLSF